jgi:hypothetical protein
VYKDEAAARLARQASEALAEMLAHSHAHPAGPDRFDWSSDALDELARAVVTIGEIVDRCTSRMPVDDDPEAIVDTTRELATAIVRRRNALLAENAAARLRRAQVIPIRRAG